MLNRDTDRGESKGEVRFMTGEVRKGEEGEALSDSILEKLLFISTACREVSASSSFPSTMCVTQVKGRGNSFEKRRGDSESQCGATESQ